MLIPFFVASPGPINSVQTSDCSLICILTLAVPSSYQMNPLSTKLYQAAQGHTPPGL